MRQRLAISALVGLIVVAMALICAWHTAGSVLRNPEAYTTVSDAGVLELAIKEFRQARGQLPQDLRELNLANVPDMHRQLTLDNAGRPLDFWHTPYVYQTVGDSYSIVTLGVDRVPGGAGIDADVRILPRSEEIWVLGEHPTFWQFVSRYATAGMLATCIVAGVFTFLIGVLPGFRREAVFQAGPFLFSLLIVGAISAFMGGALAFAHLPFEHH